MRYGIFVDSSCDLVELDSNDIAYARVPLNLDVGEKVFIDNNDLDVSIFMKEMEAYTGKTGSSAPSPNDWLDNYEKCDCIFVITISSALSGSYSSALVAKDMLLEEYPDKKIEIIDSKATGPKMTLIANYIKECIIAGQDFEEIVKNANDYTTNKTKLLFILESMENLVKNGRVSRLKGGISKILGIKVLG
ncbi:MAG: DegV family protein, partial [Lachnospiraceae bacterium]|nr:DegV family protein [Lachnospiraceae bacterium]